VRAQLETVKTFLSRTSNPNLRIDDGGEISIARFRTQQPKAQVVEIKNATHYLFLGATQDEVVRRTREFLSD
jgi:hypothetical protein